MSDILDAKKWCEKALTAVYSLWDVKRNHAWRGSQEFVTKQEHGAEEQFRPTVTYTAILAFGECGLFETDVRYSGNVAEVLPSQLRLEKISSPLNAEEIIRRLLGKDEWVAEALASSEHGATEGDNHELKPRASIVLGRMVPAIYLLARHVPFVLLQELQPHLIKGLENIVDCFSEKLFPEPVQLFNEASIGKSATVSPQIVLYAATALTNLKQLCDFLCDCDKDDNLSEEDKLKLAAFLHGKPQESHPKPFRDVLDPIMKGDRLKKTDTLLATFKAYFSRQVDRQMARKHVKLDPDYDCASLAFALNGLALLDEKAIATAFFRTCVAAVVEGQNPDGCWPEGITVAYHESDKVGPVRQPSVEIANALADCTFRRSALFRCEEQEFELLKLALPALTRQLRYLAASFQELDGGFTGWADDRLRAPGEVRMLVNATAARLINTIRLAEVASERAIILARYKPEWPSTEPWRGGRRPEELWAEVTDPDAVMKPCEQLLNKMIRPLSQQMQAGYFFLRPEKQGVSFIIYGPPGSGKTFIISRFAAALGWPLVSLNPGYFIEKGLELIESVASNIFTDLMKLDHAVVFFDECDELFRDRAESGEGARNILSFATASMLPKLQKLHDARKVLFVLGTNYVRNIDLAIRRPGRFDEILLFDRPDEFARKKLSQQNIAKFRGVEIANLQRVDIDEVNKIVDESHGWMIEQVINRISSYLKSTLFSAPGTTDYEDWCKKDGIREIEAAGVIAEKKEKIIKRWDRFIKDEGVEANGPRK